MRTSKKLQSILLCVSVMSMHVSLFGTSSMIGEVLISVSGVAENDYAVLLVDTSGSGFDALALSNLPVGDGADLSSSSTYAGFEFLKASTAITDFLGAVVVGFNTGNFDVLAQPIITGDSFGVLTFSGPSSTSAVGTSYEIWTDPTWLIPSDNTNLNFSTLTQKTAASSNSGTGTVTAVPEPSSFAAIAGCLGLAWVMARRRV